MKVIIENKKDKVIREADYPGRDIQKPLKGLSKHLTIYFIQESDKGRFDPRLYRSTSRDELTNEDHPDHPHLKICNRTWTSEILPGHVIVNNIKLSCKNWIDTYFPSEEQLKKLQDLSLELAKNVISPETVDSEKIESIAELFEWIKACEDEAFVQETNFEQRGILPTFTFPDFPGNDETNDEKKPKKTKGVSATKNVESKTRLEKIKEVMDPPLKKTEREEPIIPEQPKQPVISEIPKEPEQLPKNMEPEQPEKSVPEPDSVIIHSPVYSPPAKIGIVSKFLNIFKRSKL